MSEQHEEEEEGGGAGKEESKYCVMFCITKMGRLHRSLKLVAWRWDSLTSGYRKPLYLWEESVGGVQREENFLARSFCFPVLTGPSLFEELR